MRASLIGTVPVAAPCIPLHRTVQLTMSVCVSKHKNSKQRQSKLCIFPKLLSILKAYYIEEMEKYQSHYIGARGHEDNRSFPC
jgi:hypothetical protein